MSRPSPKAPRRCRLCLVAPAVNDPLMLAPLLEEVLRATDFASVILQPAGSPAAFQRLAEVLVPIVQAAGAAALIANDTRIAGRTRADGVHIDSGLDDLQMALAAFHPQRIVGAGGISSRHDAMLRGELDPDYVFFGNLDGDWDAAIAPQPLELAGWWSEIAEIPAVLMGGSSLSCVEAVAGTDIEFLALGRAVWEDLRGPVAAALDAKRRIDALAGLVG